MVHPDVNFAWGKLLLAGRDGEPGGWGNNVLCVPLSTPRANHRPILFTLHRSLTIPQL